MKTCKKGLHQYDEKIKGCFECKKEYDKQWYKKNKEEISKRQKLFRNRKKLRKKAMKHYYKYREEILKNRKQFYYKNSDKRKNSVLLYKYKIDLNTYNSIMEKQNYCCKICKEKANLDKSGKYYILNVDHDHSCCPGKKSCGKCIRGLICHNCNTALGAVKDNPDILYKAVEYLKSYEKTQQESKKSL